MSRKLAIQILDEKSEVILKCNGHSMQPLMAPGNSLYIKKVPHAKLRVGDAVFVKIKSNLQVHKISAIDKERFQISNARGLINGWVGPNSIYGLCWKIENKIIINTEELESR